MPLLIIFYGTKAVEPSAFCALGHAPASSDNSRKCSFSGAITSAVFPYLFCKFKDTTLPLLMSTLAAASYLLCEANKKAFFSCMLWLTNAAQPSMLQLTPNERYWRIVARASGYLFSLVFSNDSFPKFY